MLNILNQVLKLKIRAFTLLESVTCLWVTCLMISLMSHSVTGIYQSIESHLFFINFENFYRHSQKLSILNQEESYLVFSKHTIHCGQRKLEVPPQISLLYQDKIRLNKQGGNHSLATIAFQTKQGRFTYKLNLGSGTYQKTKS
ncbi:competence protein [Streptococcus pseudoporcinus]|uniref:Competence protein n=2 Tax=Streptococcus pseudoporcinus TaxID=361101 RepID=A0A4U9XKT4_9STRE|nr:competence protein [Streptococcus pseudoporcinus]VTS13452.1 competence protein [Streptococcus pseudoporcinus]